MLSEAECYVVYVYFVEVTTRLKLIDSTEKKKDLRTKKNKKSLDKKNTWSWLK